MIYRLAKKLHNNDEITVKKTKEITKVINTEIYNENIFLYVMTKDGYTKLHHREIC